jgi:hypothetical protein
MVEGFTNIGAPVVSEGFFVVAHIRLTAFLETPLQPPDKKERRITFAALTHLHVRGCQANSYIQPRSSMAVTTRLMATM